jgi:hypothetical protein
VLIQFLLGHKVDITRDTCPEKRRIDIIEVVGYYNERALTGDILLTLNPPPGESYEQNFHCSGGEMIEQSH